MLLRIWPAKLEWAYHQRKRLIYGLCGGLLFALLLAAHPRSPLQFMWTGWLKRGDGPWPQKQITGFHLGVSWRVLLSALGLTRGGVTGHSLSSIVNRLTELEQFRRRS